MKFVFFAIVCAFFCALSQAQNSVPCQPDTLRNCTTALSTSECGFANSICLGTTFNTFPNALRCVCDRGFRLRCLSGGSFACVPEAPVNATGCGTDFPNGCPNGTFCAPFDSTLSRFTCRCNVDSPNVFLDRNAGRCRTFCPPTMTADVNNLGRCLCPQGSTPQMTSLGPICVPNPPSGSSCATVRCARGFVCQIVNGQAQCVPDRNNLRCGFNFRCPSTDFTCVDTDDGPRCVCANNRAGPDCRSIPCAEGGVCLGENSVCVVIPGIRPFCACRPGFVRPFCTLPDTPCDNVQCNAPNTICRGGRCVCQEGFIPKSRPVNGVIGTDGCIRVQPPVCENTNRTCLTNTFCVDQRDRDGSLPSAAVCRCPDDHFGAFDCSRPRCFNDADCTTNGLQNAVCTRFNPPGVPSFCRCRRGFTGLQCDTPVTCNNCRPNEVCTNEGRCVCRGDRTGANCDQDNDANCRTFFIVLRSSITDGNLNLDDITTRIINFLGIDESNFVITVDARRVNGKIIIRVKICRSDDGDTDERAAGDALLSEAANNLDFVDSVSTTEPTESSASSISLSFALFSSVIGFLAFFF